MTALRLSRPEYQKRATPCCGTKPLIYTREWHQFCHRCCRAYDLDTEQQVPNWAWQKQLDGSFTPKNPESEYSTMPGRAATPAQSSKGE